MEMNRQFFGCWPLAAVINQLNDRFQQPPQQQQQHKKTSPDTNTRLIVINESKNHRWIRCCRIRCCISDLSTTPRCFPPPPLYFNDFKWIKLHFGTKIERKQKKVHLTKQKSAVTSGFFDPMNLLKIPEWNIWLVKPEYSWRNTLHFF